MENIKWEIRDKDKKRGNGFYFVLILVMAVLLLFSFWQKDILFGMFVIIASGTVIFLSNQKKEDYKFELNEKGLILGDGEDAYPLEEFAYFDICEFPDQSNEIFFVFKKKLRPTLKIKIHRGDKEKINDFLAGRVTNRKIEPSLLDLLTRSIGF